MVLGGNIPALALAGVGAKSAVSGEVKDHGEFGFGISGQGFLHGIGYIHEPLAVVVVARHGVSIFIQDIAAVDQMTQRFLGSILSEMNPIIRIFVITGQMVAKAGPLAHSAHPCPDGLGGSVAHRGVIASRGNGHAAHRFRIGLTHVGVFIGRIVTVKGNAVQFQHSGIGQGLISLPIEGNQPFNIFTAFGHDEHIHRNLSHGDAFFLGGGCMNGFHISLVNAITAKERGGRIVGSILHDPPGCDIRAIAITHHVQRITAAVAELAAKLICSDRLEIRHCFIIGAPGIGFVLRDHQHHGQAFLVSNSFPAGGSQEIVRISTAGDDELNAGAVQLAVHWNIAANVVDSLSARDGFRVVTADGGGRADAELILSVALDLHTRSRKRNGVDVHQVLGLGHSAGGQTEQHGGSQQERRQIVEFHFFPSFHSLFCITIINDCTENVNSE